MKTFSAIVELTHRHEVLVNAETMDEAINKLNAGEFDRALDDMRPGDADFHTEEVIDIIEAPQ